MATITLHNFEASGCYFTMRVLRRRDINSNTHAIIADPQTLVRWPLLRLLQMCLALSDNDTHQSATFGIIRCIGAYFVLKV